MQKRNSSKRPAASRARGSGRIQGEGDYEAARRYRRGVESFVASANIERAARNAAPRSPREASDMAAAEAAGRRRARGVKSARKRATKVQ
jgi:hypothetical protein